MRFVILAALLGTTVACGNGPTDREARIADREKRIAAKAEADRENGEAPAAKPAKSGKAKAKPPAKIAEPIEKTPVQVYFLDDASGEIKAIEREVGAKAPPRNAVAAMFRGPTEEEAGLSVVKNGAEGFQNLKIAEGVATLQLRGSCEPASGVSVHDLIRATLLQFEQIEHVKLLGPDGETKDANAMDSSPSCLEP